MKKTLAILFNSAFIALLIFLMPWQTAHAVAFSADISISGSITFDDTNSSVAGTTQGGSLSSIIGGLADSSSISGVTVMGAGTLSGNLTDIGDGFGSSFTMTGNQINQEGELFSDYLFNISNSSATDQYQVTLAIDFRNLVDADGINSFADAQTSIQNDLTLAELFFTDLTSDVLFGDRENGTALASFGTSLADSGLVMLDLLLNPLASVDLSGINELKGGVFDNGSSFTGELHSFISVANVVNLTNPNPNPNPGVPEPNTLLLLLAGMFGLLVISRRKMMI